MRLTVFATAVALVGFAGAANASATIDLIWSTSGVATSTNVNSSSTITLQVILTAGPNGSRGGSVSVDYTEVLDTLAVIGYASTASGNLPIAFGTTIDTGSRVEGINTFCLCPLIGSGLQAGQSAQIGTVTFHKGNLVSDMFAIRNGVFEIRSDANGLSDEVSDIDGNDITATTTFNSAFLIDVPPPPCPFLIEINALRGGSPTVTVGSPKNITAKARIQKGTATKDTTFDTTLRIDAVVGGTVVDTQSSSVQLEVGKGGQGDKLGMLIERADCNPGDSIHFDARFFGTDAGGVLCATRRITKTCN